MLGNYILKILEGFFNENDIGAINDTLTLYNINRTSNNETILEEYGNSELSKCIISLWNKLLENDSHTSGVDSNSSSTSNTQIERQNSSSTVDDKVKFLEKRVKELELENELQKEELKNYRAKEIKLRNKEMHTNTEVYIHLADPSYERDYLPIMETILCDLYKFNNPEDIYHKKKVHRYGELCASSSSSSSSSNTLPPPGSTVLYVLFLTSNRFDDYNRKQFLANLITNQVNVIVCLFRRARGAYLDVEEIVDGGGVPVTTIPFMVNQKMLSHEVPDLSTKEKDSLEPGYAKSLHNLQKELGLSEPKSENRKKFDLTKFKH